MMLFSTLPTTLEIGEADSHNSHCHDYNGDEEISKTSQLRDTHSKGKVSPHVHDLTRRG
jgi:hypothetical protein